MILHKIWKFPLCFCFVFNKISLEIMSHDHLVGKQALLDYKKWILHNCNIGIFSEGLTHDFGQKMKILSLDKIGLEITF